MQSAMLDFVFKKRRQHIALDIGNDSIRMLQVQQVGSVVAVTAHGSSRFGDVPIADTAKRRAMAISAVRELLKSGNFRGRKVVSSLSSTQLSIKNVRLPHMSPSELRQAVMWEAKDRFDFEVSSDQLSYLNAGEVRQGNEVRDEVILLAAPKPAVEDHLAMLEEMGLQPQHVEAEPIALFRVYERFLRRKADEQAVSVLVDIGLSASRVLVARGRQIVFLKAIDIGGRKFTEVVASHLNLSYTEAAQLRMKIAQDHANSTRGDSGASSRDSDPLAWTVYDAVRAQAEALAREIALCLRYCSVTFRGLRCAGVTLTGGEAYDPALRELLSTQLSIPCVTGAPLKGFDLSMMELGDRRGMLAEWSLCAGLAIHSLDAACVFGCDGDAVGQNSTHPGEESRKAI